MVVSQIPALNTAVCPTCAGKDTQRGGYSARKKASVWVCWDCKKAFLVPTVTMMPVALVGREDGKDV